MNKTPMHEVAGFQVTPMAKLNAAGQYAASVSLRRGLHDRVYRLLPNFDDAQLAEQYALEQGRLIALGDAQR